MKLPRSAWRRCFNVGMEVAFAEKKGGVVTGIDKMIVDAAFPGREQVFKLPTKAGGGG